MKQIEIKQRINSTIIEYFEARIRIVKAFRKLNYRLNKFRNKKYKDKFLEQKKIVLKEMRKMDKVLREVVRKRKLYK